MMISRRTMLSSIAISVTLASIGRSLPAGAAGDPAELDIGWVNVGAGSNEALLFADQLVEKALPNTKVKWVEFDGGTPGIAALNAGDIQIMMMVGLPPTVASISKGL